MPHCTGHWGWYLGKFVIGFTSMLILYHYLCKKKSVCMCPVKQRQLLRARNECGNECSTAAGVPEKPHNSNCSSSPVQPAPNAPRRPPSYTKWRDLVKERLEKIVDNIEKAIWSELDHPEERQRRLSRCRRRCRHQPRLSRSSSASSEHCKRIEDLEADFYRALREFDRLEQSMLPQATSRKHCKRDNRHNFDFESYYENTDIISSTMYPVELDNLVDPSDRRRCKKHVRMGDKRRTDR